MNKALKTIITTVMALLASFLYKTVDLPATEANSYYVSKVLDGDTIIVDMAGTTEKVRFLGVNTPETHHPEYGAECYGQQASDYMIKMLQGKNVKLVSDHLSTNRDRYDRLLRYVYTEDGVLINKLLVSEGYGFATTAFRHSLKADFVIEETKATLSSAGLWGRCEIEIRDGAPHTPIIKI